MTELTHLDEKVAEAQAAQTATKKVATLVRAEKEVELVEAMQRLRDQAAEIKVRCDTAAGKREGMRTAITQKAARPKLRSSGSIRCVNTHCAWRRKRIPLKLPGCRGKR